jgi:transposase
MANTILTMHRLKKIIKLLGEGTKKREIGRLLGMSRKTVDKYELIFSNHPLNYEQLHKLPDQEIDAIVTPKGPENTSEKHLNTLFPQMELELKKVGITKHHLWKKYRQARPNGVEYSMFCIYFNRFLKVKNVSYVFDHKAGDKLMVDFAGKKWKIVDYDTGEEKAVELFVGILPASGYTFAMATASQQTDDFLDALQKCLKFIGGVPAALVTDNLKASVTKASKYDPNINRSMADFAEHFDCCVLPTRPHSPKDKALVESAVNILYKRVYAYLHDKVFHSLPELNKAIIQLVNQHNNIPFQKRDYSRSQQFYAIEIQALKPLPNIAFERKNYQEARVQGNCHVILREDKHEYSVPYTYGQSMVLIAYNNETVEIYYKNDRIAIHERTKFAYKYTTNKAHLHPKHEYFSVWSASFFEKKGVSIGQNTHLLILDILGQGKHPEQGFKRCQGVLALAKKYGNQKVEEASTVCIHYDMVTYKKLEYILKEGINMEKLEDQPILPTPVHENIRGSAYYQ